VFFSMGIGCDRRRQVAAVARLTRAPTSAMLYKTHVMDLQPRRRPRASSSLRRESRSRQVPGPGRPRCPTDRGGLAWVVRKALGVRRRGGVADRKGQKSASWFARFGMDPPSGFAFGYNELLDPLAKMSRPPPQLWRS
jgi:hypothetical protein